MKKQKQQVVQKETMREKLANSLDASKEVILDAAKLTFIGNQEVTVENYRSICEYTDSKIVLEASPRRIVIEGSQLEIKSIARELLYIKGRISLLCFKKEG